MWWVSWIVLGLTTVIVGCAVLGRRYICGIADAVEPQLSYEPQTAQQLYLAAYGRRPNDIGGVYAALVILESEGWAECLKDEELSRHRWTRKRSGRRREQRHRFKIDVPAWWRGVRPAWV